MQDAMKPHKHTHTHTCGVLALHVAMKVTKALTHTHALTHTLTCVLAEHVVMEVTEALFDLFVQQLHACMCV
jgi:hypothetical protein